jgi:hypothetical protein
LPSGPLRRTPKVVSSSSGDLLRPSRQTHFEGARFASPRRSATRAARTSRRMRASARPCAGRRPIATRMGKNIAPQASCSCCPASQFPRHAIDCAGSKPIVARPLDCAEIGRFRLELSQATRARVGMLAWCARRRIALGLEASLGPPGAPRHPRATRSKAPVLSSALKIGRRHRRLTKQMKSIAWETRGFEAHLSALTPDDPVLCEEFQFDCGKTRRKRSCKRLNIC